MPTETDAKIVVAAETAVGGYLHDALIGLPYQKLGGILQTEQLDITVQLVVFATFREYGTNAFLRQLETVDNRLTLKIGIEEELLTPDGLVDMLEQLLIGERVEVSDVVGDYRCLGLFLFPVQSLIAHGIGNLLGQGTVLAADSTVLDDDDNGKGYTTWRLSTTHDLGQSKKFDYRVEAGIDNIFNYCDRTPHGLHLGTTTPGRTVYATLTVRFKEGKRIKFTNNNTKSNFKKQEDEED